MGIKECQQHLLLARMGRKADLCGNWAFQGRGQGAINDVGSAWDHLHGCNLQARLWSSTAQHVCVPDLLLWAALAASQLQDSHQLSHLQVLPLPVF